MDATSEQAVDDGDRPEYASIPMSSVLDPGAPRNDGRLELVGDVAQPSLCAYRFYKNLAPGQASALALGPLHPAETVYRLVAKPVVTLLGTEQQKASANWVVNPGFSGFIRQSPAM